MNSHIPYDSYQGPETFYVKIRTIFEYITPNTQYFVILWNSVQSLTITIRDLRFTLRDN